MSAMRRWSPSESRLVSRSGSRHRVGPARCARRCARAHAGCATGDRAANRRVIATDHQHRALAKEPRRVQVRTIRPLGRERGVDAPRRQPIRRHQVVDAHDPQARVRHRRRERARDARHVGGLVVVGGGEGEGARGGQRIEGAAERASMRAWPRRWPERIASARGVGTSPRPLRTNSGSPSARRGAGPAHCSRPTGSRSAASPRPRCCPRRARPGAPGTG